MNLRMLFTAAVPSAVVAAFLLTTTVSRAEVIIYKADLSGLTIPTASPGTGLLQLDYDDMAHTMRLQASFSDLLGNTTAAHIHSPTASPFTGFAGVATQTPTFAEFPLGVTSGTYDHEFDLTLASSYNATFISNNGGTVAGAEAALASAFADGKTYLNIHTNAFGGGEIRGFLRPIPEPSTFVLVGMGAIGLFALRGRPRMNK